MSNWYSTREAVKAAGRITGSGSNAQIDALLEGASRHIDARTHRWFIPRTELRNFEWPQPHNPSSNTLYTEWDLLSVTTLTKDDDTATVIAAADFFLEPQNEGPPFYKIEIDRASSAFFSFLLTTQRAVRVTGSWGFSDATVTAGDLGSGLCTGTVATSMVAKVGARVDVGNTLLIESEQVFVSDRSAADLSQDTATAMTKDKTATTVTLDGAPTDPVQVGCVFSIDSEDMRVIKVTSTTVFEVERGWDATPLAAHVCNSCVFIYRTFTITRGVNGTTAATHADNVAMTKYTPDSRVQDWTRARVLNQVKQEVSGYGRTVGAGESAIELSGSALAKQELTWTRQLRMTTVAVA